jgi:hypothetical protein
MEGFAHRLSKHTLRPLCEHYEVTALNNVYKDIDIFVFETDLIWFLQTNKPTELLVKATNIILLLKLPSRTLY